MKNKFRPTTISLSPNVEKDDLNLAYKTLLSPKKYIRGDNIQKLENKFKNYLNSDYAFSFNSGRSSLMTILKALNFDKNEEVIVQAFTCNATVNPILWNNLKPVFVDCNDNFNVDVNDLEEKITSKTRAVIIQHTFGIPAEVEKIKKICKENNLILIEDCAHSLGASYNGQKIGTFGDVAFFSFSRDKVISSVYGGMVTTNDFEIGRKIKNDYAEIDFPSSLWVFQQLIHPLLFEYLFLPLYNFLKIGKILLISAQLLRIVSKAVHYREKQGKKPSYFPAKLPNGLAGLALNQMEKIDKFNKHRVEISKVYQKEFADTDFEFPSLGKEKSPIYLRFPLIHPDAHEIIINAWNNNLLIGDWYRSPVAPYDTNLEKVSYKKGCCPNAEELALSTFNLPTHINISKKKAKEIVQFIKNQIK